MRHREETVTISAADSSTDPRIGSHRILDQNTETESEEEQRGLRVKRQILQPDYSEENEPERALGPKKGRRKDGSTKSSKKVVQDPGNRSAESSRSKRKTVRPDYSEDQLEEENRSQLYEDDDDSVRRIKNRSGKSMKLKHYEDEDTSEMGETVGDPSKRGDSRVPQEGSSGRSGRRIVKPVRLQDYSNDELIRLMDINY